MVHVVGATNRARFSAELDHMHRALKRRSLGQGKEGLFGPRSLNGTDEFDTADAIYLLELDRHYRKHIASLRLLPTTRPHMLMTAFAHLCECGALIADDIWEISLFCISPDVPQAEAAETRNLMRVAAIEFAAWHGIRQYTSVTPVCCLSEALAAGWNAKPLGMPQAVDGALVGAILYTLPSDMLQQARDRVCCGASVLDFGDERVAARLCQKLAL
jgi:N-acyl-L-homoserine lactone synthetase